MVLLEGRVVYASTKEVLAQAYVTGHMIRAFPDEPDYKIYLMTKQELDDATDEGSNR